MRKLVVFMHVSLDGFVGQADGDFSWIRVSDEQFEFSARQTARSDTALYGRVTFQFMDFYWPTASDQAGASKHDIEHSRWYNQVQKVVLSKSLSAENHRNIRVVSNTGQIRDLKEQPGQDIVVFGSPTMVHSLIADDLIDEYGLMVNPVLLGEGIPLFKNIQRKSELKLIETQTFDNGVVYLCYRQMGV